MLSRRVHAYLDGIPLGAQTAPAGLVVFAVLNIVFVLEEQSASTAIETAALAGVGAAVGIGLTRQARVSRRPASLAVGHDVGFSDRLASHSGVDATAVQPGLPRRNRRNRLVDRP